MIQAFVVDEATGVTVQRLGVPDLATLEAYPLSSGQQIIPFPDATDIETSETYLGESGAIYVRPRSFDSALQLEVAKVERRALAMARRNLAEWSGCETVVGRVDSDPDSQRKLGGAVQMAMIAQAAGAPFSIEWTLQDNTTALPDAAAMIQMGLAVGQHVSACHAHCLALKAAIDAAVDQDSLLAIDIDTGWPS